MPELPEVETIVRGLDDQLQGLRIKRVTHISPHLLQLESGIRKIEGRLIDRIRRRGKYIIIHLDSGGDLLAHLRMTGRLLVTESGNSLGKHDHLEIVFTNSKKKLQFRDLRKFGTFQFLKAAGQAKLDALGVEATEIKPRQLFELFQGCNRSIKAFLLDQHRIAGLGNIYVDESLHRSGIHPAERTQSISYEKCRHLTRSIKNVLRQAIRNMGTTFDSYRTTSGQKGGQIEFLQVYKRNGSKCRHCKNTIVKEKFAGRGTHFCPRCQKLTHVPVKRGKK